jgi:hypothetical protein
LAVSAVAACVSAVVFSATWFSSVLCIFISSS